MTPEELRKQPITCQECGKQAQTITYHFWTADDGTQQAELDTAYCNEHDPSAVAHTPSSEQ